MSQLEFYLDGKRAEAIAAVPDQFADEISLVGPVERIRDRFGLQISFVCMGVLALTGFFLSLFLRDRPGERYKNFQNARNHVLKNAGLYGKPGVDKLRLHDLRDTAATNLAGSGRAPLIENSFTPAGIVPSSWCKYCQGAP